MAIHITEEWVKAQVEGIKQGAGDPEGAHADEDNLHQIVLRAIADGTCDDAQGCAAAALASLEINFPRWYA